MEDRQVCDLKARLANQFLKPGCIAKVDEPFSFPTATLACSGFCLMIRSQSELWSATLAGILETEQ